MPLFMDVHTMEGGVTVEDVAGAHAKDLEVQGGHGVHYLKYWVDEGKGKIFCLSEAPDRDAALAVHQKAHGLMPDDIFEVTEHT